MSALELEHVCGNRGRLVLPHPSSDSAWVTSYGAVLAAGSLDAAHEQGLLVGHTARVSACDVSLSGRWIASGQEASPHSAVHDAPVFVWDMKSRTPRFRFNGIHGAVTAVAISPDDAWLAAAGSDLTLSIWDMATGEPLFQRCMAPGPTAAAATAAAAGVAGISFVTWAPLERGAMRPTYRLAFNVFDRVQVASIEYDHRAMRFGLSLATAVLPAAGFSRIYTCGAIPANGAVLLCGTTAGELVAYSLTPSILFKGAVKASTGGVHSMVCGRSATPEGAVAVFVGGGDGALRCFVGGGASWVCTSEVALHGRVISMGMAASRTWLLVGTDAGHTYRVSWACDLAAGVPPTPASAGARAELLESSHTQAVLGAAMLPTSAACMLTVSRDCTVRLWSLDTYVALWSAVTDATPLCAWAAPPCPGSSVPSTGAARGGDVPLPAGRPSARSLPVAEHWAGRGRGGSGAAASGGAGFAAPALPAPAAAVSSTPASPSATGMPFQLYVGCADGSVRCYDVVEPCGGDARGVRESWRVSAHASRVTCIHGNAAVLVTGGEDGRVRIWSRKNRDLILQFTDHTKSVTGVLLDGSGSLDMLYSTGADRVVNTYSLRMERRIKMHTMRREDGTHVALTCLAQSLDPRGERELFTGTSDGRVFVWDVAIPDLPLAVFDVAAALATAAGSDARSSASVAAVHAAPSGTLLAVAMQSGTLAILHIVRSAAPPLPTAAHAVPPVTRVNRGVGAAYGGYPRAASGSDSLAPALGGVSVRLQLVAWHAGSAALTGVQWTRDEKQVTTTAEDACFSIFNWYGLPSM